MIFYIIFIPSRTRALTKSRSKSTPEVKVNTRGQSQHQRSKSTPEVKVNTGRRLGEEILSASAVKKEGIAKARGRLDEGVAQPGRRQIKRYQSKAITVWFPDTHG